MATEKRLIDANAIEYPTYFGEKEHLDPFIEGFRQGKIDAINDIRALAPTVDAVEVVHSQWDTVFYESHGTLASYSHICPVCKYLYRDIRFKGHKYCPNCGAKMDGERRT